MVLDYGIARLSMLLSNYLSSATFPLFPSANFIPPPFLLIYNPEKAGFELMVKSVP